MLIDTHAHLNFKAFKDDYSEVIKKSFEREIEGIINIGTNFSNSKRAVEITEEFAKVQDLGKLYATVGFHPDHLDEIENENISSEIEKFKKLAENPRVVAIGEIGLDNYYFRSGKLADTKENRKKANTIFEKFLELATEVDLPVIIHSREAEEETLSQLSAVKGQLSKSGVVHCFSGSLNFARKILDLGFYVGFTGIVTYPNTKELERVVKEVPLNKILIETDCPFLAPQKYRGGRCEPWHVAEVVKKIAEIKNTSLEKVGRKTLCNAVKLFNLGLPV